MNCDNIVLKTQNWFNFQSTESLIILKWDQVSPCKALVNLVSKGKLEVNLVNIPKPNSHLLLTTNWPIKDWSVLPKGQIHY